MADYSIIIESGNTSNHKLNLSDGGRTTAQRLDSLTWSIGVHNADVTSFKIKKKKGSRSIFFTAPPNEHRRSLKKDIWILAPHTDYMYSIAWKDADGNPHEHDPIISIRPSTAPQRLLETVVIILAATAAVAVLSIALRFLRKERQQKKLRERSSRL
jgi:hypothetical protein